MSRNYEKETQCEKDKYKRLVAKIDKEVAQNFLTKIDKPYAIWLKKKIHEELEQENITEIKTIKNLRYNGQNELFFELEDGKTIKLSKGVSLDIASAIFDSACLLDSYIEEKLWEIEG